MLDTHRVLPVGGRCHIGVGPRGLGIDLVLQDRAVFLAGHVERGAVGDAIGVVVHSTNGEAVGAVHRQAEAECRGLGVFGDLNIGGSAAGNQRLIDLPDVDAVQTVGSGRHKGLVIDLCAPAISARETADQRLLAAVPAEHLELPRGTRFEATQGQAHVIGHPV